MTVGEYVKFAQFLFFCILLISIYLIVVQLDTRPDKETRKRIKELAKEKKVMQHTIVNKILKEYFVAYDQKLSEAIHPKEEITFEDWKAARETEKKNNGPTEQESGCT